MFFGPSNLCSRAATVEVDRLERGEARQRGNEANIGS